MLGALATDNGAGLVLCWAIFLVSAQQPATPPSQSSGTSMIDKMKGCMSHGRRTKASMADMSKMMGDAEKSNDPAKVRSALEQVQQSLSQMQSHMDSCMTMMHDQMGGMMQNNAK